LLGQEELTIARALLNLNVLMFLSLAISLKLGWNVDSSLAEMPYFRWKIPLWPIRDIFSGFTQDELPEVEDALSTRGWMEQVKLCEGAWVCLIGKFNAR